MSIHLEAASPMETVLAVDTEDGSSSSDNDDQVWDDWASEPWTRARCQSLFEQKSFATVPEALEYDKETYGFDLREMCSRLSLDFHQRIRLINFIRSTSLSAASIALLDGQEPFFSQDEYLAPAIEDDPLLQFELDDGSDSDPDTHTNPERRIHELKAELEVASLALADCRAFISKQLNDADVVEPGSDPGSREPRDDDRQYFQSYEENDIHAIMIKDSVRTSTYASFIQTSPPLFRDAIVLDVGCGTGILSLFAAREGAKRVFSVDASDIADKAARIVKANGLQDVITVIKGRVEDIVLPDGINHVDVIVSEWMGYALLYESMLDSVLCARDRFLRPGGVMVPSQAKMMLALCEGSEIYKERISFWSDVSGFDLSAMAEDVYEDAVADVVGPDAMISAPYVVKDLLLSKVTPQQLRFSSPFTLVSISEQRTKVHAFLLYFDIFFTVTGDAVPPETEVAIISEGDPVVAEVWPVGGKPASKRRQSMGEGNKDKIASFSTGPKSVPTHWKQTLFLLRKPFSVSEGSVVKGTFYCRKSESNSRELDVEIHYSVMDSAEGSGETGSTIVQMYKVR